MHLRGDSQSFAFGFLGLVLLAAALLVAGYGVAVGVGVMVGLLLGVTAALAFIALAARRSGRSWYGIGNSTSRLSRMTSNEPDIEFMQRHHMESTRLMGVDAGTLRRVIPVAASVETGGARVELIAVEFREHGGVATFVSHTRPPIGQVGQFLEITVSDDAGTPYVASGLASGSSGAETSRHEVRFAPAAVEGARVLTIHIDAFLNPFPGPTVRLDGPWEFTVEL